MNLNINELKPGMWLRGSINFKTVFLWQVINVVAISNEFQIKVFLSGNKLTNYKEFFWVNINQLIKAALTHIEIINDDDALYTILQFN